MAINFHPAVGDVLWCDFTGIAPEMVKKRLVVVVSPKSVQRASLATVVPLSTTPPEPAMPWHFQLARDPLPDGQAGAVVWAKCDMISVVCFDRLGGFYRRFRGGREYRTLRISRDELQGIRAGMLFGLGLGGLAAQVNSTK